MRSLPVAAPPPTEAPYRRYGVAIVDDDESVTDGLRYILENLGVRCWAYHSPLELLEDYRARDVGCILMDVRMPGMSGIEFLEAHIPQPVCSPVVLMSAYLDVRLAVRAMKLGAFDLFEKPFDPQGVVEAVNQALRHHAIGEDQRRLRRSTEARLARLTPRETETMELLLQSSSNREVAEMLGLSTRTIEVHRARILAKMEVRSMTALAMLLGRQGLA